MENIHHSVSEDPRGLGIPDHGGVPMGRQFHGDLRAWIELNSQVLTIMGQEWFLYTSSWSLEVDLSIPIKR